MDGTNRRVLVKDGLGLPNGLTFDTQSSLLCWTDAGRLGSNGDNLPLGRAVVERCD